MKSAQDALEKVVEFQDFRAGRASVYPGERLCNARPDVSVQDLALNPRQGGTGGLKLGKNIHAVSPVLDHACDAADLTLDAPQARQLVRMIGVPARTG